MDQRHWLRVFAIAIALPAFVSCSSRDEARASAQVVTVRASNHEAALVDPDFEEDDPGEGQEPVIDVGSRDTQGPDTADCACDTVAQADIVEDPGGGG